MEISIEPKLRTSNDLFFASNIGKYNNTKSSLERLNIPYFQRDYDWSDIEIEELLLDLDAHINNFQSNNEVIYFAGTILLEDTKNNTTDKIIDGQQRLTTMYLIAFLGFLISRYRLLNIPDVGAIDQQRFGDERRTRIDEFISFENKILLHYKTVNLEYSIDPLDKKDNEKYYKLQKDEQKELTKKRIGIINSDKYWNPERLRFCYLDKNLYSKFLSFVKNTNIEISDRINLVFHELDEYANYYNATSFILEHILSQIPSSNDTDKILELCLELIDKYLCTCGFSVILSCDENDSFTLFEILNDRGRVLTALDLVKNDIIKNITSKNNDKINEIAAKWKVIKKNVGIAYGNKGMAETQFIEDSIRSEGSDIRNKYVTYITKNRENRDVDRHNYFKNENSLALVDRLYDISEIKKELKNLKDPFDGNISYGCCKQNTKFMDMIKFKWGVQIIIGANELFRKYKSVKLYNCSESIWEKNKTSIDNDLLDHFLRFLSDCLLKIGLVGIVNGLSTKDLPTTAKNIIKKIPDFLFKYSEVSSEVIKSELFDPIALITNDYLNTYKSDFEYNIKELSYRKSSNRNIIKILYYLLFNYSPDNSAKVIFNNVSLEHLEPKEIGKPKSLYFQDNDRARIIDKIGNLILMDISDNNKLSNESYHEKMNTIINDKKICLKSIYKHDLFLHINPLVSASKSKRYSIISDKDLPSLKEYLNGIDIKGNTHYVPKKDYFTERAKIISNLMSNLICNREYLIGY